MLSAHARCNCTSSHVCTRALDNMWTRGALCSVSFFVLQCRPKLFTSNSKQPHALENTLRHTHMSMLKYLMCATILNALLCCFECSKAWGWLQVFGCFILDMQKGRVRYMHLQVYWRHDATNGRASKLNDI